MLYYRQFKQRIYVYNLKYLRQKKHPHYTYTDINKRPRQDLHVDGYDEIRFFLPTISW